MRKGNYILLFISFILIFSCITTGEKAKEIEKIEREIEIGKSAFAKLAGKYGVLRDEELTSYLNKIGKSVGLYTERQELNYFFAILNTEQINAYSLPGGYVMISIGALKKVKDPAALIGIIAHELGHINKKHILNNVKIEVSYNFFELLARVLAGPRQVVTALTNQINEKIEETLFLKGYDNNTEFEADLYALKILQSLNINPLPYIEYLESLDKDENKKNLESLDATHPKIKDRVELLRKNGDFSLPKLKPTENFNKFIEKLK